MKNIVRTVIGTSVLTASIFLVSNQSASASWHRNHNRGYLQPRNPVQELAPEYNPIPEYNPPVDNNNQEAVPEPVTILGTLCAGGFGYMMKRKQKRAS